MNSKFSMIRNWQLSDKQSWAIFSILLLGFIIFKIPYLPVPYFWDEAWSYSLGIRAMYEGGIGLLPSSLSAHYSKGHPLLFYFLGAAWMKIFGTSYVAAHTFSLLVSVATQLVFFYLIKQFVSANAAIASVVITMVQPIFLAQSGMLLPEILLLCFLFLSFYSLISNKIVVYALVASATIMTKESGIVIIFTAFAWWTFDHFYIQKLKFNRGLIKKYAIGFIPLLVYALFLVLQYLETGWFFNSAHTEVIQTSWQNFVEKFELCLNFCSDSQGRKYLLMTFFVAIILFTINQFSELPKRQVVRNLYKPIVFVIILLGFNFTPKFLSQQALSFYYTLLWLIFLWFVFTYVFLSLLKTHQKTGKLLILFLFYVLLYLSFSSFNFLTFRYLLPIIFIFIATTALLFEIAVKNKLIFFIFILALGTFSMFQNRTETNICDINLQYKYPAINQCKVTHYCEAQKWHSNSIYCSFLMLFNLKEEYSSCLSEGKIFENVTQHYNDSVDYLIFCHFENPELREPLLNENKIEFIKRFEEGDSWYEIYKQKSIQKDTTNNQSINYGTH